MVAYHPVRRSFDAIAAKGVKQAQNEHKPEILVFDAWTETRQHLRGMTPFNRRAQAMDSYIFNTEQPSISPVVTLQSHSLLKSGKRCPNRFEFNISGLPGAIGYNRYLNIRKPVIWGEKPLDGEITAIAMGPRNLIVTARHHNTNLSDAAASIQLLGDPHAKKGLELSRRTTTGRLVAFLGTLDGIAIAVDIVHRFLTQTDLINDMLQHCQPVLQINDAAILAGAADSEEARLFSKVYAKRPKGIRMVPTYAMPIVQGALKSRGFRLG